MTFSTNLCLLWKENQTCRFDELSAEQCEYSQMLFLIILPLIVHTGITSTTSSQLLLFFLPFTCSRSQSYQSVFWSHRNSLPRRDLKSNFEMWFYINVVAQTKTMVRIKLKKKECSWIYNKVTANWACALLFWIWMRTVYTI